MSNPTNKEAIDLVEEKAKVYGNTKTVMKKAKLHLSTYYKWYEGSRKPSERSIRKIRSI